MNAGSDPAFIAPGPDGNLWFTDVGSTKAIGRITPGGQITEFSSGLNAGSDPAFIAPGPDGNLWFTDEGSTPAVGRIGAGAPGAVLAPPGLSGAGVAGSPESCRPRFATWAGVTPSAGLYSFDGYRWLRDGALIPGASPRATPPAAQTSATGSPAR